MSDIIRRDPRTEWIARNRLHPLYESVINANAGEVRGPTGLLRKNPHKVGFIGPNGIKRIDRLKGNGQGAGAVGRGKSSANEPVLALHQIEAPDFYIMVAPDLVGGRLTSHDKDVLGLAHKLCRTYEADERDQGRSSQGAVVAVCFGEMKEESLDLAGVDRLIHLQNDVFEGFAPEARLEAVAQIEQMYQPKHWLFPDSIHGGADLGSRLSARLGERPAVQAWQVDTQNTVCRGASSSIDITRATPRILLLLEECGDAIDETRHEAKALDVDAVEVSAVNIVDHGLMDVDPNAIPLAEAEFILSAGNGIHNWEQFHDAAKALGATEGASRVAVDDGFMPRFRQVGATGTWVTARVYVAVGISGAIQHMQGIGQCDKVVAINTDSGCDMVKRAALSVIGDSEEILEELVKIVNAHKGQVSPEGETLEKGSEHAA
ncbi:electron transfer flavoprotein subunit alpha/FixB family protein [Marinomonas balearica]|uniref:Electron transfer flavoprotein alpha subunit apoprotein n=1 Tax=Marinomonas balearica TaxID=491947 RepID=A0A4R6ME18_9GAMM|nr:electron transfer flavoprotein subunit alpha/FixB family protein [Marinomonas balearica]TDO99814.1 electron transfer flavoprotein alpha subunit apoprotein [Marinomonas balearica]